MVHRWYIDASVIFFLTPHGILPHFAATQKTHAGQALSPDLLVFLGQLEELLHSPAPLGLWGRDWGDWV